jgi:hypothetical protein
MVTELGLDVLTRDDHSEPSCCRVGQIARRFSGETEECHDDLTRRKQSTLRIAEIRTHMWSRSKVVYKQM